MAFSPLETVAAQSGLHLNFAFRPDSSTVLDQTRLSKKGGGEAGGRKRGNWSRLSRLRLLLLLPDSHPASINAGRDSTKDAGEPTANFDLCFPSSVFHMGCGFFFRPMNPALDPAAEARISLWAASVETPFRTLRYDTIPFWGARGVFSSSG